jgi:hypothetical protein
LNFDETTSCFSIPSVPSGLPKLTPVKKRLILRSGAFSSKQTTQANRVMTLFQKDLLLN